MSLREKRLWIGVLVAALLALAAAIAVVGVTRSGQSWHYGPGMMYGRGDHGPGMMSGRDGDDGPGANQGNGGGRDEYGPGMMNGSAYRIPAPLDAAPRA
jgi:hypothetical protein